jgi:hypothetical protein
MVGVHAPLVAFAAGMRRNVLGSRRLTVSSGANVTCNEHALALAKIHDGPAIGGKTKWPSEALVRRAVQDGRFKELSADTLGGLAAKWVAVLLEPKIMVVTVTKAVMRLAAPVNRTYTLWPSHFRSFRDRVWSGPSMRMSSAFAARFVLPSRTFAGKKIKL